MMQNTAHTPTLDAVKAWILKQPAISFYILSLTLSWSYWLTMLALGLHVEPGSISYFPGLLGPMLAGIAITGVIGGRKALLELLGRMVQLTPKRAVKLMLALSPLALGAGAYMAIFLMGKPLPNLGTFAQVPGLAEKWPFALVLIAVILVNGFGEETGWRGFLLERLLLKHGRVRATLMVALAWAFWHLPLFWLNTGMATMRGPMIFGWLFALFCGAFVLTQVYLVTGRSILCVALWHVAFNIIISGGVGTGLSVAIVSTTVMLWGFVLAVLWWRAPAGSRRSPAPPPPS